MTSDMTTAMAQDPNLVWGMIVVISSLAGVAVYLHKGWERSQEANIKALLTHKSEMQSLLEKTLSAFNEVERKIIDTDMNNRSEIKETVSRTGKEITLDIKEILSK